MSTTPASAATAASTAPAVPRQQVGIEYSGFYSALASGTAGIIGGAVVAGFSFLLGRRKYAAEVASLTAQAEKFSLETEKLRKELGQSVQAIPAAVASAIAADQEFVVYASGNRNLGHDFKAYANSEWRNVDGKDVPVGDRGEGSVVFEPPGGLSVQRTNTAGRFELALMSYKFNDRELDVVPKDEQLDAHRRLRLSFEAKVIGSAHTLRVVFKDVANNRWLASSEQRVEAAAWTRYSLYFQVPHIAESRMRIDDARVEAVPSSIQLRNVVLAQRRDGASAA